MFSIEKIRQDFPILQEKINGFPLIYFDNGATSQKPKLVIEAEATYYETYNANIHRGVHHLSQVATNKYEESRQIIADFLNIKNKNEVIFTSGTTQGINTIAHCFTNLIKKGDEILISYLEHHANIVPWQMLCERTGAVLKVIPLQENGILDQDVYKKLLNENTKILAISHVSNTLGIINPIEKMIEKARKYDLAILIDGAQAVPHFKPDLSKIDCDFYVFSGHKLFAPTGIGVLYGKEKWLEKLPPFLGGGDMIKEVTFEKTTYNEIPFKFEAGTPNISGAIALGVAIKYVESLGLGNIHAYENELLRYANEQLKQIENLKIYGNVHPKVPVISLNVGNIHPFDLGSILDKKGIALRTGHHCTQPIMDFYNIPGTLRASFAFYNTKDEIDFFVNSLQKAIQLLS
jgi:cysteine desulfurase / selenocysteine lyase